MTKINIKGKKLQDISTVMPQFLANDKAGSKEPALCCITRKKRTANSGIF